MPCGVAKKKERKNLWEWRRLHECKDTSQVCHVQEIKDQEIDYPRAGFQCVCGKSSSTLV